MKEFANCRSDDTAVKAKPKNGKPKSTALEEKTLNSPRGLDMGFLDWEVGSEKSREFFLMVFIRSVGCAQ